MSTGLQVSRNGLVAAVRELVVVALLAGVLYLVIHLLIEPVRVEGFSMEPTLDNGDYLVATTLEPRVLTPHRGDIVVLKGTAADPRDLIKRVVGLPGDHLVIAEDGSVCVNGHKLSEPYVADTGRLAAAPPDEVVIPEGQYWMMGDNRGASRDSRSFGPVATERIEARAFVRLLPGTRLGALDKEGPALTSATCG